MRHQAQLRKKTAIEDKNKNKNKNKISTYTYIYVYLYIYLNDTMNTRSGLQPFFFLMLNTLLSLIYLNTPLTISDPSANLMLDLNLTTDNKKKKGKRKKKGLNLPPSPNSCIGELFTILLSF